jgi:hypothetical protein
MAVVPGRTVGWELVVLAAAVLLSHDVRAMEEGGGSSGGTGLGGMGSDLPMIVHGGTVPRVEGVQTLDLEEYIMEDTRFMGQHIINMEVRFVLYIVEDDSWGYQIGFVLYIMGEYMLKNTC